MSSSDLTASRSSFLLHFYCSITSILKWAPEIITRVTSRTYHGHHTTGVFKNPVLFASGGKKKPKKASERRECRNAGKSSRRSGSRCRRRRSRAASPPPWAVLSCRSPAARTGSSAGKLTWRRRSSASSASCRLSQLCRPWSRRSSPAAYPCTDSNCPSTPSGLFPTPLSKTKP